MPIGLGLAISPEFLLGAETPVGALLWGGTGNLIVWGGVPLVWS